MLRLKTVKDSKSILLTNVLVLFTGKYSVSSEEILSKNYYRDQVLGLLQSVQFTVNDLKGISSKFGSGVT